jgi:hypothetical protein
MEGNNRKLKIAFLGQPEYFRCLYERDLDDLYDVREYKLIWGAPWYYYSNLIEFAPDIAFFFRADLFSDELVKRLPGKKVALSSEPIPKYINGTLSTSSDMEYRFASLKNARNKFDHFFHFDRSSLRYLQENGFKVDGDFMFPVATGTYHPTNSEKKWDIFFGGRDTVHRDNYLKILKRDFEVLHISSGIFSDEYVRLINACKIGVNIHVDDKPSIEHRIQNMMACGNLVMSEPLSPNDMFIPGRHYVEFSNKKEFLEKFLYYYHRDSEREVIARNGLKLVRERLASKKEFPKLIGKILGT